MSDMRKLLKIMENVAPVIADATPIKEFNRDDTVAISPNAGGGVGRFVDFTQDGKAIIDIKGISRELNKDDFSHPDRDIENGNDWFHMSVLPGTPGTQNDKPEFRPGDIVKIADVYGAVIGPGFGTFIAYGTTGQDCVILFDGKEIVVPVENVASVLEQESKNNFDETDNDGNLSPMTFGSENVKIEEPLDAPAKDRSMDHRDEFSKWIAAVEGSMSVTDPNMMANQESQCGCEHWDCKVCFPDDSHAHSAHDTEVMGQDLTADLDGELVAVGDEAEFKLYDDADEANEFHTQGRDGEVKLGDIVQKTEIRLNSGQKSPMTFGKDNLKEGLFDLDDANDRAEELEMGSPLSRKDYNDELEPIGEEDRLNLISQILNFQSGGLSNSSQQYSEEFLSNLNPVQLRSIHSDVMGNVKEATKPTKTKNEFDFDLDDFDILGNKNPLANIDNPDDTDSPSDNSFGIDSLRRSSADDTRRKTSGISASDEMRDLINRINPDAGMDEPERPEVTNNQMVVRTATDVPAVISNAIRAAGVENPEWHTVNNLPGMQNRNIRGIGRSVFGAFTSTPQEHILTIANVNGQGPNSDAEIRAVAGWLMNNAEDLGKVDVDYGNAIPGYKPDVKEFRINGVRFHVVRDPVGQYIYAYPDKDARIHGNGNNNMLRGNSMPQLRETMPTIYEQIAWDEEILEAFIEESTLSRLIGKQKGGQNLVRWLHKKHKLSNEAELVPAPFNERIFWKQFKSNPDDFVIVTAQNGVAGIKPSEEYIKHMQEKFAKKGKVYNPSGDANLQYQAVAFTDDGRQIDPSLLQAKPDPDKEEKKSDDRFISRDPTVIKARMGLHSGKDMQNPDNVFNLLAEQIGALRMVYISGFDNAKDAEARGSVERSKMAARAELKATKVNPEQDSVQMIFKRVRPVLKKLGDQAYSQIVRMAQRYTNGGNFEAAEKTMQNGKSLKDFMVQLDSPGDINLNAAYGSPTRVLTKSIIKSLEGASGARSGSDEFKEWLDSAAKGNSTALQPVLDGLRQTLVNLGSVD